MTLYYPDISGYNTGVSLHGCQIVAVKATEGTGYINPDYRPAISRAKSSGTFFVAYHFLLQGNGAAQARFAHALVGSTPLMIDCEQERSSNPRISDVADFVNEYRSIGGVTYLLYMPKWYWQGVLGSPSLKPVQDLGMLLVSSDYTSYSDTGPGWSSYGGMTPLVWQYTDSGKLNGQANIDYNAFKGTLMDFRSYAETGAASGNNPVLQEGDSGPAVKLLQQRLNVWGDSLTVDGVFGTSTLFAVKIFQTYQQLKPDGIVGPATWALLNGNPGVLPYPAPTGLSVSSVSVTLKWDAVIVDGKEVTSYTVEALGLDGGVYARQVTSFNYAVLTLNQGWTYNIRVWANGGQIAPPHATLTITV